MATKTRRLGFVHVTSLLLCIVLGVYSYDLTSGESSSVVVSIGTISVLLFIALFVYTVDTIIQSIRHIYNPDVTKRLSNFWLIAEVLYSYLLAIYGFGIIYRVASIYYPSAFGATLDLISAFYFSVVSIETVGFGDILPRTSYAKLLVMGEILIGTVYKVFVFSILAGLARGK